MSRVAVLEGGQSLERQVSLRSGARVRDALERLGHDVVAIDVGPDLVERLTDAGADVAFVPGRAAYVDGRGGSEMRLNFSGSPEARIREGIRRIGNVVREQVGLYGTLTGATPVPPAPPARQDTTGLADVLPLPARRRSEGDGAAGER